MELIVCSIDLAVGSYLSGHAVVLRSRPVLQFNLSVSMQGSGELMIQPTGGSTLTVTTCAQVFLHLERDQEDTCLELSFYFDAGYLRNPRLSLNRAETPADRMSRVSEPSRQPYVYNETFSSAAVGSSRGANDKKCRSFTLAVSVISTNQLLKFDSLAAQVFGLYGVRGRFCN